MTSGANATYTADQTLVAATPLATVIPLYGAKRCALALVNSGVTNSITAVKVEKDVLGDGVYVEDTALGTAIGTIAHDAGKIIEFDNICFMSMRLTLTSTGGTTARVRLLGRE